VCGGAADAPEKERAGQRTDHARYRCDRTAADRVIRKTKALQGK
jgi:hypothetical protein